MTGTLAERLRGEWTADVGGWGAPDAAISAAFDELSASYAEAHRHYHTLEHVAVVLRTVDGLATDNAGVDHAAVRLAAWYHDVVYDPQAHDNEARSAVVAAAELVSLGVPTETVEECARLIDVTAHHAPRPGDRNGMILVDADLAVLASSPGRYDRYRDGIRAEYAHVDDAAFVRGRLSVLGAMVDRPNVFFTPSFRTERDARARANIEREIEELVGDAG